MIEINIDDYCHDTLGMHINKYCERMIDIAKKKDAKIVGDFNGIRLEATKDTVLKNLVSYFRQKMEENNRKYLESDEYKEEQIKHNKQVHEYNNRLFECVNKLPTLTTNKEILMAIDEAIDATDFIGIDNGYILRISEILKDKGFKENDFVRDTSIYTNSDSYARYIIGQVLNMIEHCCAIHGIVHSFIKIWMEKFGGNNDENN